jgi:hypothetical protein
MEKQTTSLAEVVAEMSEEEKTTEYDYVGLVASRKVGEKGGEVMTSVSEDTTSPIALLGRLAALGLALGYSHEKREALSCFSVPAAEKVLAAVEKSAQKAINKVLKKR